MLGSRRGRPSLIGRAASTAARTAVITKTATTVAGNAAAKQATQQAGEPAPHNAMPQQPAAAPMVNAAQGDTLVRLRTLSDLHDGGMLSDADFIAKVKEGLAA